MGWQPELARELSPLRLDACCLPFLSHLHGPLWECRTTCPVPRSPSAEPIQGTCAG